MNNNRIRQFGKLVIALIVMVLPIYSFGQGKNSKIDIYLSPDVKVDTAILNGRFWEMCNRQEKMLFIAGMLSGVTHYASRGNDLESDKEFLVKFTTPYAMFTFHNPDTDDVIVQMDKYYSDPANKSIPITEMYVSSISRLAGASSDAVEKGFIKLRNKYSR